MAIITISRGSLSGGRAVAECLARRLGYPCLGREVLREAAGRLGAPEETVRERLEVPPRRWLADRSEQQRYLLAVRAVLAEHCAGGDLVYHGLAGQFLLEGVEGVLRIRLIAPLHARVRALTSAHHRTSRRAAEAFITRADRDRRRWARVMYDRDVEDPALYDVTLNLEQLSLATACAAAAELAGRARYAVTPFGRAALRELATECRGALVGPAGEGR